MGSALLTDSIPLLFLTDSLHDVPQELDDLFLAVLWSLQDVQDGLGCGLVLGEHPLQPHIERLLPANPGTLLLSLLAPHRLPGLGAALSLLGSVAPPDLLLRF